MTVIYYTLAAICVALWAPIVYRFYKSWQTRGNPVSLAICSAILLLIWSAIAGIWVVTGSMDDVVVRIVTTTLSIFAAISTYLAFSWSEKNFPDQRDKEV